MFEKASRMKLRFSYKGLCTAEDLWDLSVEELDSIFKKLNSQMKAQTEESLLATRNKADEVLAMKVDIVRHIVQVKLAEADAAENAAAKAARKQKLLGVIARKQEAELEGMSLEDLNKLVESL